MVEVKHKLTGSGYGLFSWVQQRVTAIVMLVFLIAFLIFNLTINLDDSILSWQRIFDYTLVKIFAQIFFIALILHAWIGMRDLWMDYIQSTIIKLILYTLTILWLMGSLIYSIKVIW